MATVRPDYAKNGLLPSKNNRRLKRFMSPCTDTASPLRRAQIDAAQQRS
jgi:hypothetical protein